MQLDRMHAIPAGLKPVWDRDFLALLYDTITQKTDGDFGLEVFNRVERTFCCGLQSSDPDVRKKVRPWHGLLAQLAVRLLDDERSRALLAPDCWFATLVLQSSSRLDLHMMRSFFACTPTVCQPTCLTACVTSSRWAGYRLWWAHKRKK